MSKIDHADDAVDHGVADGDQAIDRAEYNSVDELLGEIVHALPLVGALFWQSGPGLPQRKCSLQQIPRRWPRQPERRVIPGFLTVGTRCGNSTAGGLTGL